MPNHGAAMIDRRTVLASALAALAGPPCDADGPRAGRHEPGSPRTPFRFRRLAGGEIRLADYADRPVLVVNTASLCGFTPQYAGLQQLWSEFHDRGLMIVGVPSNDFGARSRAAPPRSRKPRSTNMALPFRCAAKAVVKGPDAHPFYKWAANARPKDVPRWNFHKYLIGRDRLYRGGFSRNRRPPGYAGQDRDCAGACGLLTQRAKTEDCPRRINRFGPTNPPAAKKPLPWPRRSN